MSSSKLTVKVLYIVLISITVLLFVITINLSIYKLFNGGRQLFVINFVLYGIVSTTINLFMQKEKILTLSYNIGFLAALFLYMIHLTSFFLFGNIYDLYDVSFITISTIILQTTIFYVNYSTKKILHLILLILFIIIAYGVIYIFEKPQRYYLYLVHLLFLINSVGGFLSFTKKHGSWNKC